MKEEKKEAPIGVLWGWGKPYHGKFIGSIILAVLGVACQMVPYFCVAHIVTLMLSGEQDFSSYMTACIVALCGYLGKVVFANLSTVISHTATYYTLRDLRENITAKLARVPMGTILDTPSGQYKTTIVDRVEGMEPTFAHLIPEMTANVLVPIVIVVYLLILDWRMALLSLVTLVVGLVVLVEGRMQNDNYKNRAGENVYGMRLMIEEISFAESKKALESGNDEREEPERETRASSNRNRSDRAENQRSASRSTRSERAAEMDDRDYDREREGGRYRSNTRTDASDDRRRSNSGGTRSRGTSARSRERSQDIDDRYMETDDEKLDFD